SGANYQDLILKTDLTITPATIMDINRHSGSSVFDGTAKSLAREGELPIGPSVRYENNSRINVGTQEAMATVGGDNYEDLVLTAQLTITPTVLTITVDAGQGKVYGTDDPALAYTAAGFALTDD